MENAVDALKLAFAILIFVMGLAMLFSLTSQAKETATILIAETDKTKYYTYYGDRDADNYYAIEDEAIDKNGNRVVSLSDIIPVLYRYSEENYGVTIVDKSGQIVARFDLDTESACNNWITATDYSKWKFITETNNIYTEVNILANRINSNDIDLINLNANVKEDADGNVISVNIINEGMTALLQKLYSQVTSTTISRSYYCYWIGTMGWTSQRVDSDLSGIYVTFSSTTIGAQTNDTSNEVGNHVPCISDGLISKFSGSTFTEYLVEVDRNTYITNDDESLFSFGEIMQTIKKEIIYVEI